MMKLYSGCVEDRNDPLKLGRCKVRIVGLHTESRVSLPTDDLPWAYPIMPVTSAGTSGIGSAPLGPVEGTWVLITFMDPDEQMPMMLGTMLGAHQTPDALVTGEFTINEADPNGEVNLINSPSIPQNPDGTVGDGAKTADPYGGQLAARDGKIVTEPGQIVGPLANLIAKAESGKEGYTAYNKGTANGKIIPADKPIDLTKMSIKEIMAKQALPPGDPNRLFAVGKYQTIPVTLKSACQALNLDINQPFDPITQDIICQEFLVARKRPALVAYYRNPDKNNEKLLMNAGKSLAAEFASIEDPYFLGFPYNGPEGSYYKAGNRAKTKWVTIRETLVKEWEFRNDKKNPPPTAKIAGNDKIEKGADLTGVESLVEIDDSSVTPPRTSSTAPSVPTEPIPPAPVLPDVPLVPQVAGASASQFGNVSSLLGGFGGELSGILGSISSAISGIVGGLNLNTDLTSFFSSSNSILSQFGSNISDISNNLGIENVSGSLTELSSNLGIPNATPEELVSELEKRAGSSQGQAASLLAKLEEQGEPTKQQIAPIGQTNPDGSPSNGTGVDPTVGFQDPNGKFPLYRNEQDTNRLATGNNLGRTVILKKEAAAKTGVRIANGGTWDQSPNPYNATYPYNKVTQTESGHIQEWDDTPGSERIHTYHRSGTFSEIDANGTQVNRIVGDGFEIMERNGFIYVKGAYCVTVDGAMNLRTDNVFNLEVSGAANINIYNNANINVSGNTNLAVGATLNAKADKINLESVKQFNIKAGTGLNIEAGMDINVNTFGSLISQAGANISTKAFGGIFNETAGDVNNKADGGIISQAGKGFDVNAAQDIKLGSSAKISIKSGADTSIDTGGILDLNNGSAASPTNADFAIDARFAGLTDLELPLETRGTSGVDRLPALIVPTRGAEVGFDAPVNGAETDPEFRTYQNNRVQNNETSKSEIEDTKFERQRETPAARSSDSSALPPGAAMIRNMPADQFTAGMKISKYFTLGDLTKGGVRIPRVTYNVRGRDITPQEIVINLMNLATNVLDPIYEKYGKFTITSGFRRPPFGAAPGDLGVNRSTGKPIQEGGDHPTGCAADIAFSGGKQETYRICSELVKMLPAWNQVIMEYDGNKYWIHVSCKPSGNKGDMFTMVNHKTYQGTFPKGGFVLV